MEKERLHFFYSEKQNEYIQQKRSFFGIALINGNYFNYSMCGESKDSYSNSSWDDLKYLGEGVIYSINGVKQ